MNSAAVASMLSASVGASAAEKISKSTPIADCPVVDMRLRPIYPGFKEQFTIQACESCAAKAGMKTPESVLKQSDALMLKEMDEANVRIGVGLKRNMDNAELVKMQDYFKGRIATMCVIDASAPVDTNMELIKKFCLNGPFKGIYLEPGRAKVTTQANAARLFPLYQLCQEHDLVVGIMTGGNNSPNVLKTTDHSAIVEIAATFPKLRLLMAHGGWPQVQEMLGIAYWYPNIYVEADMYMFGGAPGWREYVDAANGYLQDRFLFGSAYPLLPIGPCVAAYKEFFPKKEVYEKIMYKNAQRLLGLSI